MPRRLSNEAIKKQIMETLLQYRGKVCNVELDSFVGQDLGISGEDSVELLEEVRERYGVDLLPLVKDMTVLMPPNFVDRLLGRKHGAPMADMTVAQVIDYVLKNRAD